MYEDQNMFTLSFYLTLLADIPTNTEIMIAHLPFSFPYICAYIYICMYVLWNIDSITGISSVNLPLIKTSAQQPERLNYIIPEFSMNGISVLTRAESQVLNWERG